MHALVKNTLRKGRPGKSKHDIYILKAHEALPEEIKFYEPMLKLLGDRIGEAGSVFCTLETEQKLLVVVRLPARKDPEFRWALAKAVVKLPEGKYAITYTDASTVDMIALVLGWSLAQYSWSMDTSKDAPKYRELSLTQRTVLIPAQQQVSAIALVRDLINQPPNIMHPQGLGEAASALAERFGAKIEIIAEQTRVQQEYPAIHAVGRAATAPHQRPRLIKMAWGNPEHPRVSLVGKGVCFDSGGLDIKPAQGMRLMKKDMGGAANVLGTAELIMAEKLPIYLQVLIPAVENAISGDAYRPSDVINTRAGKTIEVDNTDAEGRIVLSDALAVAVEEESELIIDFATLTGAARVAVGTEIAAMFTRDAKLRADLMMASETARDALWPLPLHQPYLSMLRSPVADYKNCGPGYGGAITAGLFLGVFVPEEIDWVHLDLMGWNVDSKPGRPVGGEAMGLLAITEYLRQRYGSGAPISESL